MLSLRPAVAGLPTTLAAPVVRTFREHSLLASATASALGVLATLVVVKAGIARPVSVLLLVAAAVGATVLLRPLWGIAALLVLQLTVLPVPIISVSLGGVRTDPAELVTLALLGGLVVTRLTATSTTRRPHNALGVPVVLFEVAAVYGAVHGLANGTDRQPVQGVMKVYLLYLLLFVFAEYFRTSAERDRLERWILRIATSAGAYVLVAAATGLPVSSYSVTAINTLGVTVDAQRIRPAVLSLLMLATLLLLAAIRTRGLTPTRAAQLTVFVLVWAFSFSRSSWLGLALAAYALVRWLPKGGSYRALRSLVLVTMVAIGVFAGASSGSFGPTAKALSARATSVINPDVIDEPSYRDRADETKAAFNRLSRSPVAGLGIGQSLGVRRPFYDAKFNVVRYQDRSFLHNSYLLAYVHFGALGILAMLVLVGRLRRLFLQAKAADDARRLAAVAAFIGLAVSFAFEPFLLHVSSAIAVVLAMCFALPTEDDPATVSP